MPELEISLWKQPTARYGGKALPMNVLPGCWPLLALLTLSEKPLSREWLSSALWPDAADSQARANLRRHLHRLTHALPETSEPWIVGTVKEVAWNHAAPARIDTVEFTRAIAQQRFADAAELYGGDLLSASYEEAIIEERERLRECYLDALERLTVQARASRDFAAALRYAERLLEADEWREDAVRALMTARYQSGDRSGALAAYEKFVRSLYEELRVAPMQETTALRDAIMAGASLWEEDDAPAIASDRETGVPFVGRGGELQAVRNTWLRAARGHGSTLFIAGEPGIGKTRLTLELCATVDLQGGRSLIGRTSSPEGGAYQAVIEALRDGLSLLSRGDLEDVWWATLAPAMPEIARLHPNLEALDALDPSRSALRLREAFIRLAAAMARRRPLAIVLEDLHWAQRETLELVDALAHRVAGLPVVLALTYRSGEVGAGHQLQATRRRLQQQRRGQTVALARLGEDDLRALARELLPGNGGAGEVAARVYAISEGNPLFAVQLLRFYADTGEMPSEQSAIGSVGDAVISRVDRLPPGARSIADASATIGGTFTVEEVARIGGWDESVVLDSLAVLLDAKIVCERGGERFCYGFTHALIESAIRDAAPAAERATHHRRIAEVLEDTREGDATAGELIATHWVAAGDPVRAALAYYRAALSAFGRYARRTGMRLGERALELGLPDRERFEALRIVVDCAFALNESAAQRANVAAMEEVAQRLGDEALFQALYRRAGLHQRLGETEEEERTLPELLQIAVAAGRPDWISMAHLARGRRLLTGGDLAKSEEAGRASVAAAREAGDFDLIVNARELLIQAILRQSKVEEGAAEVELLRREVAETGNVRLQELLVTGIMRLGFASEDPGLYREARDLGAVVSERTGDARPELVMTTEIAYSSHIAWDTAAAREAYLWSSNKMLELGMTFSHCVNLNNLGCIEREIGHLDRAEALFKRAQPIAKRLKSRISIACHWINLADIDLVRGEVAAALKGAQRGIKEARDTGERRILCDAYAVLAAAECANAMTERGLAHAREGLQLRRTLNSPRSLAHELSLFLEELVCAGKHDEAAAIAAELRPLYDADPDHQLYPARIALALASEAEARGDSAEAAKLRQRGLRSIEFVLSRLTEPSDREAFSRLPHNRALLEANLTVAR